MDERVATTRGVLGAGSDTRRFVTAPDGRAIGEYGSSTSDVRAEFIWMNPEVGDSGAFGGDDGLGGYMPIAVVTTGGTLNWVHADHLGTPIVITDASGTAIPQPGGYTTPAFPGQSRTLYDLYYNRYRDYDPTTGRYIQADPIGLAGDVNPYSYAMGNPLRYTDPSGRCIWDACVAEAVIAGAVIGAVTDLAIQAGINAWNGRDVFDANCYDWGQVVIAGGLGGLTGGLGAGFGAARAGGRAAAASSELVPLGASPLGAWGETRLAQLVAGGVKPRSPFSTPLGNRYVDRLLNGVAYESKAGLNVGLNSTIERQIAKDGWLIQNNIFKRVE
jgi:RHS repeat-associated protein